jgi:hypothetical protein
MARLDPNPYPGFTFTGFEDFHKQDAALKELLRTSKNLPEGEVVGAVLRFQIADGWAYYIVTSERPLTLQHIPFGDGYAIAEAHVRGLNRQDVLLALEQDRRFAGLH